ncbi:MAG: DUF2975 domain-containing protein [Verrucomicrobiota bacterium]
MILIPCFGLLSAEKNIHTRLIVLEIIEMEDLTPFSVAIKSSDEHVIPQLNAKIPLVVAEKMKTEILRTTVILFYLLGLLWILSGLFKQFEKGNIFEKETVRYIKWMGYGLIGWAFLKFVLGFSSLMEFSSHSASIQLEIDFPLVTFLTGFLLFLMSWIMEEGLKIQEEQKLTI